MIRKLTAILIALLMLTTAAAPAEGLLGGWTMPEDIDLTDECVFALDAATAEYIGATLEPMALLGTQLVSGTNYCLLCRCHPTDGSASYYALAYVYEALTGECTLTNMIEVNIADWAENYAEG